MMEEDQNSWLIMRSVEFEQNHEKRFYTHVGQQSISASKSFAFSYFVYSR